MFEQRSPGDIRIGFNSRLGSWSFIGTHAQRISHGEPTMNLGCIHTETKWATKAEEKIILHEFAHALGLEHDHQPMPVFCILTFTESNAGKVALNRLYCVLTH